MTRTTLLLVLSINILCYCQQRTQDKIFPGSNLRIQVYEDLKYSDNAPGFESKDGNTKIYGFQAKMELTFDNAIIEQEKSIKKSGYIIIGTKKFTHQGQEAATIEYEIPDTDFGGLIFLFGKENFQNIISSVYPKDKKDDMRKISLTAKIDETVIVALKKLQGFSSVDKSGLLIKTDESSMVITYEERNKLGELTSNLKLTKFPKDNFSAMDNMESIEALASKFFLNPTTLTDSKYEFKDSKLTGHKRVLKTIKKNGNPQYNYLVFIRCIDFDIVVVGSTNEIENTKYMDEITNSIRLD